MNASDNTELILLAQGGDPVVEREAALTTLYERYKADIFRYLYFRVGDAQAAEDLTSEVFLRMIRAFPGYRPQAVPFAAWLFQIARNIAIDYYRKSGARQVIGLEEGLRDENSAVEASVERGLTSQSLRNALGRLSDDQRDVMILRFITGMSISEAARALHKSEDAIKGLQRRGLAVLKELLTD